MEIRSDSPSDDSETLWSRLFNGYNVGGGDALVPGAVKYEWEADVIVKRMRETATEQDCCLVCLEEIRVDDPVWHCGTCFNLYHLVCIQRWAKEGVRGSLVAPTDEDTQNGDLQPVSNAWCCPKCRCEYAEKDCPVKYMCFCGKKVNPQPDPWVLPHSCGDSCDRLNDCEHRCKVLCHPGPCPPCPKIVRVNCHCGKSDMVPRRCGNKEWSCQRPCDAQLACKFHLCLEICHPGDCPPCSESAERSCLCRRHKKTLPCAAPPWHCDEVCGKLLKCGNHTCSKTCHAGPCDPCVPEDSRTCPCGKTVFETINCVDDQPCCGDTCGKLLACGFHECLERCHTGDCLPCAQQRQKLCRCGAREKLVQCGKPFLCDTKCKKMRSCKRHACNRRCCDGKSCPTCEQPCGRLLPCRNHKCSSTCHTGLCYPCPILVEVKCACGKTKIRVPCGKEKAVRPPKCHESCERATVCHHEQSVPHRCHFGDCPPCSLPCGKKYPRCSHECANRCHSAVLMDTTAKQSKQDGPILPCNRPVPKIERVELPCPPCMAPVDLPCAGSHEIGRFPCHEAKPGYCCGRPCGKLLACGNHKCSILCHSESIPCEDCRGSCSLPRPEGCSHPCIKPCHPAPCPPCRQSVRKTCHCGLVTKHIPCTKLCQLQQRPGAGQSEMNELLCCGDRCPKLMPCGHRCLKNCHIGDCSGVNECPKKVPVHCACRNIKKMIKCLQAQTAVVECDEECREKQAEEAKKAESLLEAEKLQTEEVVEFKPKKSKRRDRNAPASETKNNNMLRNVVFGTVFAVVIAGVSWYMSSSD